jgi:hypothetical protein
VGNGFRNRNPIKPSKTKGRELGGEKMRNRDFLRSFVLIIRMKLDELSDNLIRGFEE